MNHSQQRTGPAVSEFFSSDVLHLILGSPTDTIQALDEAVFDDAKVEKITVIAKNMLKKFFNNDFIIHYQENFEKIRIELRKLLAMRKSGTSDYAVYNTANGKFAFRIANHNARGDNFAQNNANMNISVYVAFHEYEVPKSNVKYTEYKIKPEVFNKNKKKVINAIINAVAQTIDGNDFSLDETIAEKQDYPITGQKTENSSQFTLTYNKKKVLYESIMYKIAKIVKSRINQLD